MRKQQNSKVTFWKLRSSQCPTKKVLSSPLSGPQMFYRTLVRGTSEPQTGLYRTNPHLKHVWSVPSHEHLQTNYCTRNSRNIAIVVRPLRTIASREILRKLLRQKTTIAVTPLAESTPSLNTQTRRNLPCKVFKTTCLLMGESTSVSHVPGFCDIMRVWSEGVWPGASMQGKLAWQCCMNLRHGPRGASHEKFPTPSKNKKQACCLEDDLPLRKKGKRGLS